ncbi:hypothetical protein, partial [Zhongshania antarctica]|uniref:hypothetical protein n=1 Tax=Zhongshania antarctica TaxID=641702 RepID=UPI001D05A28A
SQTSGGTFFYSTQRIVKTFASRYHNSCSHPTYTINPQNLCRTIHSRERFEVLAYDAQYLFPKMVSASWPRHELLPHPPLENDIY